MDDKKIQEFISKNNYSAWSCFRAGQVVQMFVVNIDVDAISIDISENENANEIQSIVSYCVPCDVKIERDANGIILTLTRHYLA